MVTGCMCCVLDGPRVALAVVPAPIGVAVGPEILHNTFINHGALR
eukprot:COSAG06_NODE_60989_length_269_cov_0.605882_1_plen_44_part_10